MAPALTGLVTVYRCRYCWHTRCPSSRHGSRDQCSSFTLWRSATEACDGKRANGKQRSRHSATLRGDCRLFASRCSHRYDRHRYFFLQHVCCTYRSTNRGWLFKEPCRTLCGSTRDRKRRAPEQRTTCGNRSEERRVGKECR